MPIRAFAANCFRGTGEWLVNGIGLCRSAPRSCQRSTIGSSPLIADAVPFRHGMGAFFREPQG